MQYGWTPLFMACYEGYEEVVKLLLARSDVAVNLAIQVRGRGEAGRERAGRVGWGTHYSAAAVGGSPHSREASVWGDGGRSQSGGVAGCGWVGER
jgi:ankyrin repeat protein